MARVSKDSSALALATNPHFKVFRTACAKCSSEEIIGEMSSAVIRDYSICMRFINCAQKEFLRTATLCLPRDLGVVPLNWVLTKPYIQWYSEAAFSTDR